MNDYKGLEAWLPDEEDMQFFGLDRTPLPVLRPNMKKPSIWLEWKVWWNWSLNRIHDKLRFRT